MNIKAILLYIYSGYSKVFDPHNDEFLYNVPIDFRNILFLFLGFPARPNFKLDDLNKPFFWSNFHINLYTLPLLLLTPVKLVWNIVRVVTEFLPTLVYEMLHTLQIKWEHDLEPDITRYTQLLEDKKKNQEEPQNQDEMEKIKDKVAEFKKHMFFIDVLKFIVSTMSLILMAITSPDNLLKQTWQRFENKEMGDRVLYFIGVVLIIGLVYAALFPLALKLIPLHIISITVSSAPPVIASMLYYIGLFFSQYPIFANFSVLQLGFCAGVVVANLIGRLVSEVFEYIVYKLWDIQDSCSYAPIDYTSSSGVGKTTIDRNSDSRKKQSFTDQHFSHLFSNTDPTAPKIAQRTHKI